MNEETVQQSLAQLCRTRCARHADEDMSDAVDYALLARVADGTATADDVVRARTLLAGDAELAAALESHARHGGVPVAPWRRGGRARRVLAFVTHVEVWVLRAAACLLVLGGAVWFGWRGGRKEQPVFRGAQASSTAWTPAAAVQMTAYDIEAGSYAPQTIAVYNTSCALLIGVDQYDFVRTGFDALRHCVSDVTALDAHLRAYQFSDITRIMDHNATRRNVLDKLDAAMRRAGPRGALLIYFAGHGYQDPQHTGTGYLIPYDGSRDERVLAQRNIPIASIKAMAKICEVQHVYLVLDCCYAGMICMRAGYAPRPSLPDFHYVRDLVADPVVQVLAAAAATQPAIDGLFGRVFRDTLARMENRPFVTADTLNDAVKREVALQSRARYDHIQVPVSGKLRGTSGDYVFVPTSAVMRMSMPHLTNQASYSFARVPDCRDLRVVDLNGNGTPEFIGTVSNRLCVFTAHGALMAQRRLRQDSGVALVKDIDGDGMQELFLVERHGTTRVARVLSGTLRRAAQRFKYPGYYFERLVQANTPSMREEYHKLSSNRWYREYGNLGPRDVADLDGDHCPELLANWFSGYAPVPRALLAFDYVTGALKWKYETAAPIEEIDIDDSNCRGGQKLLALSTYAPWNGRTAADGTSDSNSYVVVLDALGHPQWRRTFGRQYTGTTAKFVDLDLDGNNEILVFMRTTAWPRDIEETGDIYVLDKDGVTLYAFANTSSVESVCVYPNYKARENCVLAALRNGELVLLDARLRPMQRVPYTNTTQQVPAGFMRELLADYYGTNAAVSLLSPAVEDGALLPVVRIKELLREYYRIHHGRTNVVTDALGISAHPRICGFLRTSYGEFVVVLYYEHAPEMINVVEQIAGPRSVHAYFNVHIKLLDKITLAERFHIPLARWTLDAPNSELINLFDVDQDGQDELLVQFRDRIEVHKVVTD
jgi:hypothetical protein